MNKLVFIILFSILYDVNASEVVASNKIESMEFITIRAGSHTKAQNEANERKCNEMGGYDVTDKQDVRISKDTKDPLVCHITDVKKSQKYYQDHNDLQN